MVRGSGPFADRFEPVPLKELGRPRVDVVVSMCGFFRDMFPGAVRGLSELFSRVSALEEPDDSNYVAADTRSNRGRLSGDDADELAGCRLFGPAPSEYGTGLTDAVSSSSWKDESELGDIFSDSLRYAYLDGKAVDAGRLLRINHSRVQMVSQIRDSCDREIIDLDHYYEFLGGLSKAVENASGKRSDVYVADCSGPVTRTLTLSASIEHGVRSRLLNPKWIDGLLDVKYNGAQEIGKRFENILGLSATTGALKSSVFDDMSKSYIEDEDVRERMMDNNVWAYLSALSRMSEAYERGYWKATDEQLKKLKNAFVEAESRAEEKSDDRARSCTLPPVSNGRTYRPCESSTMSASTP